MADDPYLIRAREDAEKVANHRKAEAERELNNPEMAAYQPQLSALIDCYAKCRDRLYDLEGISSPSEISEYKGRVASTLLRCEILSAKWENLKAMDLARTAVKKTSNHRNPKVAAFVPKLSSVYQCHVDFRDHLNELDSDPSIPPEVIFGKYKQLQAVVEKCKALEETTTKEMEKELTKWHFNFSLSW